MPPLVGSANKCSEQRMRRQRLGLEFRVELTTQKPRMLGRLNDFHVGAVRRAPGDTQTRRYERLLVITVEFVSVAVALANLKHAVGPVRGRARFEPARPRTQAHRAPHFVHAKQFAELIDDPMWRLRIKFGAVGLWQPADVARVLNGGALHAEANAKERHLAIAGVVDSVHHPGNAALSEAPGHEDAVYVTEPALGSLKRVDFLGF